MQPLEQLNNVQKARLVHALFIGEMPAFLEYVGELSAYMAEHADSIRQSWDNAFFGAGLWLELAADANAKIKRYGKQLHQSSSVFAEQLFEGYGAVYLNHCLSEYAKRDECSPKLRLAIELIINP